MVHERIPRILYEHPIVEYIPLIVTDLWSGPVPASSRSWGREPYPSIHVLNSEVSWRRALRSFPFAFPPLESLPPLDTPLEARLDLTLLALGFRVVGGIYRNRKVSLAAASVAPVFHLFTVPRIFFYKPKIDVVAFDQTGTRLAVARDVEVGARTSPRIRS